MTSNVRGPCTPRTRIISMSAVADGPEIVVMSAGFSEASRRNASGNGLDDLIGADDAQVVVGNQRRGAASFAGTMGEHDRAGQGDGQRCQRQHSLAPIEILVR